MKLHGRGYPCLLLMAAAFGLLLPRPSLGATGLSFLQIGAGGRAVALGDAVVSHVQDASATYWNPGALPAMVGNALELSHVESMQGVRYEFASVTGRKGRHGFGASFNGLWTDRLQGYDKNGDFTGDFGYYDVALAGSYGFALTEKVGVGASVEYLREVIDIYHATGLGFGLGIQGRELLPGTSFGLSLRHAGAQMKFEEQRFDLPMTIQGGVSYLLPVRVLDGRFLLAVEGRKVRDSEANLLLGTEYQYRDLVRLQVGYRTGLDTQDLSMGFGAGRKNLRFQYAYVPFSENLGNQQRISLGYSF